MQAYYEIETNIPQNHHLNLILPNSIPSGYAKVAIIYEFPEIKQTSAAKMAAFLNALPDESETTGLSREAINQFIQQERQDWD